MRTTRRAWTRYRSPHFPTSPKLGRAHLRRWVGISTTAFDAGEYATKWRSRRRGIALGKGWVGWGTVARRGVSFDAGECATKWRSLRRGIARGKGWVGWRTVARRGVYRTTGTRSEYLFVEDPKTHRIIFKPRKLRRMPETPRELHIRGIWGTRPDLIGASLGTRSAHGSPTGTPPQLSDATVLWSRRLGGGWRSSQQSQATNKVCHIQMQGGRGTRSPNCKRCGSNFEAAEDVARKDKFLDVQRWRAEPQTQQIHGFPDLGASLTLPKPIV